MNTGLTDTIQKIYPLDYELLEILFEKINLPPVISNQKMNEYLKNLREIAEFNDLVEQHRYS